MLRNLCGGCETSKDFSSVWFRGFEGTNSNCTPFELRSTLSRQMTSLPVWTSLAFRKSSQGLDFSSAWHWMKSSMKGQKLGAARTQSKPHELNPLEHPKAIVNHQASLWLQARQCAWSIWTCSTTPVKICRKVSYVSWWLRQTVNWMMLVRASRTAAASSGQSASATWFHGFSKKIRTMKGEQLVEQQWLRNLRTLWPCPLFTQMANLGGGDCPCLFFWSSTGLLAFLTLPIAVYGHV